MTKMNSDLGALYRAEEEFVASSERVNEVLATPGDAELCFVAPKDAEVGSRFVAAALDGGRLLVRNVCVVEPGVAIVDAPAEPANDMATVLDRAGCMPAFSAEQLLHLKRTT